MKTLQNKLFLQNKAKFKKVKLNVNKVLTMGYDQMDTWSIGTKQSQTNPNKAKSKKAEMNVTSYITKEYENKSNWALYENKPKQSQFYNPAHPQRPATAGKEASSENQLPDGSKFFMLGSRFFMLRIKKEFFGENVQWKVWLAG